MPKTEKRTPTLAGRRAWNEPGEIERTELGQEYAHIDKKTP